ncbi:MAG: DUF58 domain-containing protein [Acidobacteriota bacterium]
MRRRPVPEGIRITHVGLWFVLLTLVVGVAATNTGNNALYMVLAAMLGLLVVSGLASRHDLRGLGVVVDPPGEVYANRPLRLRFELHNRSRFMPRWMLQVAIGQAAPQLLVPFLPRAAATHGHVETILSRRGRHRIDAAHLSTLFPLGFFRKGLRYPLALDLLVFPELFPPGTAPIAASRRSGEESMRRVGRGHELHALRAFRPGDDPRAIHWKQTARTGTMIFMEREAEESRRLMVVFDNAVGKLDEPGRARFERLVSEAATAAADGLQRGFEVELVTRERVVPFGRGQRQRWAILEALALIEPTARSRAPLVGDDARAAQLRFSMVAA